MAIKSPKMGALIALFLICFIVSNCCYSQIVTSSVDSEKFRMFSSPNAQSLGSYGKTPVNLFDGCHQLSIPIMTINEGDISIPISLDYNSGGDKVNSNPGWVGLSWNLLAGGTITRERNGEADESTGGDFTWPVENGGITEEAHAYVPAGGHVTNSWPAISHDFFYAQTDKNPDEFHFSVNGMSGSFFRNEVGEWKVKSKANIAVTVKSEIGPLGDFYSVFKEFILIDSYGNEYVFGGDVSNVEVSVGTNQITNFMLTHGSFLHPGNPSGTIDEAWRFISFPTAWYLKEIRTPKGHKVVFTYQKLGMALNQNHIEFTGWPHHIDAEEINTGSTVKTSFLRTIETNDLKVEFNISKSNGYYLYDTFYNYNTPDLIPVAYRNDYYKLNDINLINKVDNGVLKQVSFTYTERPDTRLKLDKVAFNSNNVAINNYEFIYNSIKLPSYQSVTDSWGFHNGSNPTKAVDESFVQAEMLTRVKYPTGGHTDYYYEPNTYSKVAKQYPFVLASQIGLGGGVRVSKTIDHPIIGPDVVREFYYVSEGFDRNQSSSGILSGVPRYHYSQNIYNGVDYAIYNIQQNFMVNTPGRTFGKDITYSRVVEKVNDGYRVYKYSNHDNGYMDIPALDIENPSRASNGAILSPDPNDMLYLYSNRELSRGNLIREEVYSGGVTPNILFERENIYNEDLGKYVKAQGKGPNGGIVRGFGFMSTFVNYIFTPFITKSIERNFTNNGVVVKENDYTYNEDKQLQKATSINSLGKLVSVNYKYPKDFISNTVYQQMVSKNIISPVIEKEELIDNLQAYTLRVDYDKFLANNLFLQKTVEEKIGNSPNQLKKRYKEYSLRGNILEEEILNGVTNAYLWGYNERYSIAEFKNAKIRYVQHLNFEEVNDDFDGNLSLNTTKSHTGKVSGYISNASSNEITAHGRRIQVNLTAAKRFTYSGWIYSDGPPTQIFLFMMRAGEQGYYSYVDNVDCNQTGKWVYISKEVEVPGDVTELFLRLDNNGGGNAWFDDLAIRPSESEFSTYTYEPLVGMTSMIDPKGITTYYEYDSFQRLRFIKDQDGNIIKSYCYNYAGQNVDCNALPAPPVSNPPTNPSGPTNPPSSNCSKYQIHIPDSAQTNLYMTYQPCSASSPVTVAVDQLPQTLGVDGITLELCIYGTTANFEFRYGANGSAEVINGLTVTSMGACQ